jgi:hypothetical protein
MMMAYDSSGTPASRLADETIKSLRTALAGYLVDSTDPVPLQGALVRLSAEAREKEILPEQLLVVLKDLWSLLPEVRAMKDASAQLRLQQRVVTMCIKEYYAD